MNLMQSPNTGVGKNLSSGNKKTKMKFSYSQSSKTLNKLVGNNIKIEGYDDERNLDHGYIVYTSKGFCWEDTGLHTYGFNTVSEVLQYLFLIKRCNCEECL